MKTTKFLVSIFLLSIVFTSCANDEEIMASETTTELLKSYTIAKNAQGEYSVNYNTNNASSQLIKNEKANTNEIYLYASAAMQSKNFYESLDMETDKLQVNFIDTNTDKKPAITIIDDQIVFAKGSKNNTMLADYSITGNEDGTFDLAFSVHNNVNVDFVFNDEIDTYEIHLVKGKGGEVNFTRTFETNANGLKIDFVNNINTANKGYAYKGAQESTKERKPRIVVDTGN